MARVSTRLQRTLGRPAWVRGTAFLSGRPVRVLLLPARADSGVVFRRTDLRGAPPIPATADQVTGTARRTTLGRAPNHVTLVEHMLAALAGCRIDNCVVEIDGPELPGLDGSALGFVDAIHKAGAVIQPRHRRRFRVTAPMALVSGSSTLKLEPHDRDELRVSYLLDYGLGSPVPRQAVTLTITAESFVTQLAPCRTFLLDHEAREMQAAGMGTHLGRRDLLVFGRRGVLDNRLRFGDEPARHKVLDLVGDLSLFGQDIVGRLVAYRTGHPHNVEMARRLSALAGTGELAGAA